MPRLHIKMLGSFQVVVDVRPIASSSWRLRTAGLLIKALALAPGYRLHREQLMELLWPDADAETAANNLRYSLHTARRILASSGADTTGLLVRERDLLVLGSVDAVSSDVAAFETTVADAWRTGGVQSFRAAASQYTGDLLPDDCDDDWINERRETLRTSHLALLDRLAALENVASPKMSAPSPGARSETPNNLPAPLTRLIGRERELAEVRQLLTAHRLVTLTGPGGVGKTRLAEEIGRNVLEAFPDGVWIVSLAPLRVADLVIPSIGRLLGLREAADTSPLEALQAHLAGLRSLLILDNFEHLLDAAPVVTDLLGSCPSLRVLATSRARLRLGGERTYPVPPLDLPPEHGAGRDAMAGFATIRLFTERAREVAPSFQLTDQVSPAVATICRRLDGLPLAIELAAARVDEYPVAQLASHLERRLLLLSDGPRDLPTCQQTLWNTIAWSYDLLTTDAQRLFRRLSVFAGGWTLEAAVAVTNDDEEVAVLAGLERLVEHNLVRASEQTNRDVRFSMLETIREYSLDRLEERGEAEEARQRHAQHFLDLVDRAEPELRGPEQQRWLDRLEAEHDNLRAALQWPGSEALPDSCLRLAAGLWQFWMARGYVSEGRGWLSRALATGTTAPSAARAKALDGAGVMAIGQGDYVEAKALLEESLASFRAIGNKQGMARAMHHLGIQRLHQGDHGRASALFDEALALFRELADLRGVSSIRHLQGELFAEQGDLEQAQRFAEESLALWRTLGDKSSMSTSLDNLAILAFIRGDYDRATMLAEEGRDLARELGNKRVFATSLLHLGDIALEQGDLEQARRQYVEGLMVSREIGDRAVMISCLDGVACLAIAEGKPDDATRLFSSVDALSDAIGISRPAHNQHRYERHLAVLCTQLSADDFTAARNAGRLLSLEEVVAGVLADAGG